MCYGSGYQNLNMKFNGEKFEPNILFEKGFSNPNIVINVTRNCGNFIDGHNPSLYYYHDGICTTGFLLLGDNDADFEKRSYYSYIAIGRWK